MGGTGGSNPCITIITQNTTTGSMMATFYDFTVNVAVPSSPVITNLTNMDEGGVVGSRGLDKSNTSINSNYFRGAVNPVVMSISDRRLLNAKQEAAARAGGARRR